MGHIYWFFFYAKNNLDMNWMFHEDILYISYRKYDKT